MSADARLCIASTGCAPKKSSEFSAVGIGRPETRDECSDNRTPPYIENEGSVENQQCLGERKPDMHVVLASCITIQTKSTNSVTC
jgi:hypothetical protein